MILSFLESHIATILELAKNFPSNKPKPKIYATCGTEDDLLKDNHNFRDEMKNTAFDYTYEEWPGGHDWNFFNESLIKILEVWHNGREIPDSPT